MGALAGEPAEGLPRIAAPPPPLARRGRCGGAGLQALPPPRARARRFRRDRWGGNRASSRFPTTPGEILKRGGAGDWKLTYHGVLQTIYTGEPEEAAFLDREWSREQRAPSPVQTSELRFPIAQDAAELDRFGEELDPRSIILSGYMAYERFADDLPREYGLAESGIPGAAEAAEALRETVE